jgi:hydrogenase maturation protein HypF
MLPYTPLHHLLMRELGFPIVATSGNLSDEPICTDEREALQRLQGIADRFLVHDRPIVRHVDDSVARVMMGRELVLRRARGYAPLPIALKEPLPKILAVGAHLKNTIAMTSGQNVFLSQHIGDLETPQAFAAFKAVVASFQQLYEVHPQHVACDMHPEYLSTKYARQWEVPLTSVQHHHAHVVSCMAENELSGSVLGISWDGTGYGPDGTVWGGEFLRATEASFQRVGHLRTFRLPGGEKAIKEPRRTALGVLYECWGEEVFENVGATPCGCPPGVSDLPPIQAFSSQELSVLRTMLARGLNSPLTSSAGRLFDAVASLVGLRQEVRFEGQAAMELEFALAEERTEETYPFRIADCGFPEVPYVVDWEPMVRAILGDVQQGVSVGHISAKFHNTLVEIMVAVARQVGEERVVLTGGCFQNKYLTERAVRRLEAEGFRPYWHQRVPPNDGGIALGQAVAAYHRIKESVPCV